MSPTLQDIATDTQTSVSTVSRVLSGGAMAQRISASTREKILEAAKRLGYRPNLLARSLRTRRSHTIALLVSDITNPWFGRVASLIERSLHRHGYSLVLCNSGEDPKREAEYLKLLPQKGIDGLILVPQLHTKEALFQHVPSTLPVVVLDRAVEGISTTVSTDQNQLAGLLCDTLEQAGIKRVAIVRGPGHVATHSRRFEIVSKRFEVIASHEGIAQRETGRAAWEKFAPLHPPAVVCTNNFLCQGVLDGLVDAATAPVLGVFDEVSFMNLLPVPMACAMQDVAGLAEACVAQLLPLLQPDPPEPKPVLLTARAVTNTAFAEYSKRQTKPHA